MNENLIESVNMVNKNDFDVKDIKVKDVLLLSFPRSFLHYLEEKEEKTKEPRNNFVT